MASPSPWNHARERDKLPEPVPQPAKPSQLAPIHLTPREREILELLVDGLGDAEIAHALGLSPRTVSWYIGELLKPEARVALAVYAIRNTSSSEPPQFP